MTSVSKTLTAGPIPKKEAMFYVFPGDVYIWKAPSEQGGGKVVFREFIYNQAAGKAVVAYETEGGNRMQLTAGETTSKAAPVADIVYFKVQVGDEIQHIDISYRVKVTAKEVTFDEAAGTATVKLTVDDIG